MGDDSHQSHKSFQLFDEWSLLWGRQSADKDFIESINDQSPLEGDLSVGDNSFLDARKMSDQRKFLHQQLEKLIKEIDLNQAKLESLKLVGKDPTVTMNRIIELNTMGEKINEQIQALDQILKKARLKDRNNFAIRADEPT